MVDINIGDVVSVNDAADVYMNRDIRHLIGKTGRVVELTKGGLYILNIAGDRTPPIKKKNLTPNG